MHSKWFLPVYYDYCQQSDLYLCLALHLLFGILNLRIFSEPETDILEGATSVFTDQVALEVAAAVMAAPSGFQNLRNIYHLICNNSNWLFQQLDIPLPLPAAGKTTDVKTLRFQLKLTPQPEETFVPTVQQNRIGSCSFSQVSCAGLSLCCENSSAILNSLVDTSSSFLVLRPPVFAGEDTTLRTCMSHIQTGDVAAKLLKSSWRHPTEWVTASIDIGFEGFSL